MIDLLAVGDVMLDVLGPAAAARPVHAPLVVRAGGSAVNAARAAVHLGARAAVVGRVGDDPAGRAIADELRRSGIDARLEIDAKASTGTAVYLGEEVVADRGANARFSAGSLPPARVTLVSGYLPVTAIVDVLARASGLRAVDLQGVIHEAFAAEVLLGPGLDLEALADGRRVVCSTLGARGAIAVGNSERAHFEPAQALGHSPVGAGDAFAAGFLLALADHLPLAECLARGGLAVEYA